MSQYKKPRVWQWKEAKEEVAGNRPTAGPRFKKELPRGKEPLQVYSLATPNGIKVAILLEELKEAKVAGAGYDLYKIDISQGDQFGSEFVALNPNAKIPVLLDQSIDKELAIFESGSILYYLADKYQIFFPSDIAGRTECLNWIFWQTGTGPYLGGGFGHFYNYAPFDQEYPIDRYTMEAKREFDLLDQRLKDRNYILGDQYTIADMMIWPWYGRIALGEVYPGADEFLNVKEYPYLLEWTQRLQERPAVQRAINLKYKSIN